ncbi:MAG: amidohydrolase family protein [Candidatus Glassbacteria bacterium]|nr:amidohydrolase family protein [Candidatus Glassbacteria bacterium]
MLSRMLRLAVSTLGLAFLVWSGTAGADQRFILDSHIHAGHDNDWVQRLVSIYREHNAMACVLTWMDDFELIKKAAEDYPDVVIPYGRVDPDDPNAVREIEKFYQAGFVGIKFHSPEKNWDDPSYFQMYRLCEYLGLPMLFHTGITSRGMTDKPAKSSTMRMRPGYLDLVARAFPRTMIQGAHFGNPFYDEAAEACRWNPNLFFDITGSTLHKLIKLDDLARFKKILWWSAGEGEETAHTLKGGPDAFEHIVFGTDEQPEGLIGNIERFQKFLDANEVPERLRAKMWGLTIARILDIDPETHQFRRPRPLPPGSHHIFEPGKPGGASDY